MRVIESKREDTISWARRAASSEWHKARKSILRKKYYSGTLFEHIFQVVTVSALLEHPQIASHYLGAAAMGTVLTMVGYLGKEKRVVLAATC